MKILSKIVLLKFWGKMLSCLGTAEIVIRNMNPQVEYKNFLKNDLF